MSSFRFADAQAFQLFWLIPLVIVVSAGLMHQQRKRLAKHIGERLTPFLISSVSMMRRRWKLTLEVIALGFFIVALARPQTGESQQKVKSEGVELMILFDVSRSMLTEDVKPSRMEIAKKELMRFLESGAGDRMGLVAFAGSAITLSPMTNDRNALKMFIESLSPDSVQTQGTEFRRALLEAENAFEKGGVEEDDKTVVTRAILIVSDGEDNEQGAMTAAKELAEKGIHIFTLAVGSEKGGAIPVRDQFGNLRGHRKNKAGKVIMSRTSGQALKDLAKAGKGAFYHLSLGGPAVKSLRADLSKLEQAEFATAQVTSYDEQYQSWLFIGLLFALFELVVSERRRPGRLWKGRFEVQES